MLNVECEMLNGSGLHSTFTIEHSTFNIRFYHRWYAGCPSFTATKVPRQVSVIFPFDSIDASTTARSSVASTTCARMRSGAIGVGRFRKTWKSEVTVHGGVVEPLRSISTTVAAQLLWQSSSAPMMPPFRTLSKAA